MVFVVENMIRMLSVAVRFYFVVWFVRAYIIKIGVYSTFQDILIAQQATILQIGKKLSYIRNYSKQTQPQNI